LVREEEKEISVFVALNTNRDKYHSGSESPNISINEMFS
jgi:hypothetical protein